MSKKRDGTKSGFSIRTAKEEIVWHGFRLKRGMMFGEYKGEFYVFTGNSRASRRRDGTNIISVKVYTLLRELEAIDPYWESRWIHSDNKSEGIVARKFVKRKIENNSNGVTISSDNRQATFNGRALFTSDKSGRGMNNPYILNARVHGY